ncbi:MAG: hypothetical protein II998_06450 [Clostridia bacterium]|nr:hypothetical protein [Clostridia bacterium]
MKKFFVALVFILTFSATVTYAGGKTAVLPNFDVSFNNQIVESDYRQFPLIVHKDITYFPMTYYDCRHLGLTTDWNNETRTLTITKENINAAYREYTWDWINPSVIDFSVCDFNIMVNGKVIDNSKEEYPLLIFRDVTYFPLTWRFAVDEFGWEYNFDMNTGLSISSDNHRVENLKLPHLTGDTVTDGKYYYYNADQNGKNVIMRAPCDNTEATEIILELPDTNLSQKADLVSADGNVYITYIAGTSPIMSTAYSYRVLDDGSVINETPSAYSLGKHGYSEVTLRSEEMNIKGVNQYVDSPTEFSYTIGGAEFKAELPEGRVRLGRRRDGRLVEAAMSSCVQIYNGKIYYTGVDLDKKEDSALYVIDTTTGKTQKLLDGVCGFHVYTGWVNEEEKDSTMIFYDNNGSVMRYTEINNDIRVVDDKNADDMILVDAVGDYTVYAVLKTIGGNKTVVKAYSCYASGDASINGAVLMDTVTGTYVGVTDNNLTVSISGEAYEDKVRFLVIDGDGENDVFVSSDSVKNISIYNDILLYGVDDYTTVRVDLNHAR